MSDATLRMLLLGEDRSASSALRGVGNEAEKTGGRMSALGGKLKGFGVAAAAGLAVAGAATVTFGMDAIGSASDLNETLSKSRTIFGDNANAMEKWAKGAARSAGLSKAAALESAAGFGDMFSQIGFGGDQAAKMSKNVVQMAADLGSFNNLPTADVADRMSAAFRGEYDSLQALIPNINAARVESEAMAATGKKTAKELTAQEKAAAVLAIVHKDGANAMGDFAKTSDGLANQQKILQAQFENTKAKIGQVLLPVATQFVTFLNDQMGPGVKKAGAWFQEHMLPALQAVGGFIKDHVIPAARTLAESVLKGLRAAFDKVSEAIEKNKPTLKVLGETFVNLGKWIAEKVLPILGKFYEWYLPKIGDAIGIVITVISKVAPVLLQMAKFGVDAFRFLLNAALSTFEGILWAADKGLGWIPGLGDKIKGAKEGFTAFKDGALDALSKTSTEIDKVIKKLDEAAKPRTTTFTTNYVVNGTPVTGPRGPKQKGPVAERGFGFAGDTAGGAGSFGNSGPGRGGRGGRRDDIDGVIEVIVKSDTGEVIERKLVKLKRTRGKKKLEFES